MEKKILIAVDGSMHSKKAVEYALKIRSVVHELSFVLFYVQPNISDYLLEEAKSDVHTRTSLKALIKKNQAESEKLLHEYKTFMVKSGVPESNIETITRAYIKGVAKDILDFAKKSLYDAILLGKRGVSRLEETFAGSVSSGILEHTDNTPVWTIDGKVANTDFLVAVDGSESALRAIDHAAFMLEKSPDARLTLLHVKPRLRDYCAIQFNDVGEEVEEIIVRGSRKCVADFYEHAKKRLEESGIMTDRISIREVSNMFNIGKTVVTEAEKLGCSNVVIGRTGLGQSFFLGSVSRYVLAKATNCAVWLVP